MQQFFLILAVIQGLISQSIGIYFILQGSYKPQRMTRFMYLLMSLLFIGTLFAQGSRDAIYLAAAQGSGTFLVFLLSLKFGMGGTNKLDIVTFAGFVASLLVWKITNDPALALLLSIITDSIAFIPTIEKTWRLPQTEEWRFYLSDVLASAFSLLSLTNLAWGNVAFPLYIFLLNFGAVVFILGRRKMLARTTSRIAL